ncbi:hypothetical protein CFHF_18005 [Caulobacter flavus]|jgi:hypothetical protein|uniref:Uncharacterized protein n=1 Tax=Caulobacter flavus TaxID=1679497 RepID=A0A2N5CQA0_9CAUL|nr:hypothetical protein [Caulobacter flavus]AYV46262.1 hypothetical protein C1707_08340 [Caulobacter flavus]PLR09982.1 hypothetical protein CFHF_18005 [Caulobacter flavus]
MAGNGDDFPDPLDDPENYALMEKLFAVAMGTADEATQRDAAPYVAFLKTIAETLMEATDGMSTKDAKAFLDRWAEVVIARDRVGEPKIQ